MFAITLVLNLFSHWLAVNFHNKTILENRRRIINPTAPNNRVQVLDRYKKIDAINIICYVLLVLGLAFLICYTSINLINPSPGKCTEIFSGEIQNYCSQ